MPYFALVILAFFVAITITGAIGAWQHFFRR
jgi:hypothetical protein